MSGRQHHHHQHHQGQGPPPNQGYQQPYYGAPPGPPPGQFNFPQPQGGGYGDGGYAAGGYGGGAGYAPQYAPQYQQQYPPPPPPPRHYPPPGPPPMQYGAPPPQNFGPPPGQYFQPHQQQLRQQHNVMYSNCSGRRKALCIGINYGGTSNALKGCHNDAKNMASFLRERYNFKQEDIVMLMDTPRAGPKELPTHDNMLRAMHWLVRDAQPHDSLFFHYSGHGGQTEDLDGDEDDGFDETIYPLDFKQKGMIVDDLMHDIMVRPLPRGCRLTAIFDSCHSGTALDLPFVYSTHGTIKEPNLLEDAGQGVLTAAKDYMRGDLSGVIASLTGLGKKVMHNNPTNAAAVRANKMSHADVVMWSGCKDSQTSADASEAGRATGAMSYAFISALRKNSHQTYMQLLNTIRDEMKGKYDQRPQLSCSHELDCNLKVIF